MPCCGELHHESKRLAPLCSSNSAVDLIIIILALSLGERGASEVQGAGEAGNNCWVDFLRLLRAFARVVGSVGSRGVRCNIWRQVKDGTAIRLLLLL